jgi:hypothetical protein
MSPHTSIIVMGIMTVTEYIVPNVLYLYCNKSYFADYRLISLISCIITPPDLTWIRGPEWVKIRIFGLVRTRKRVRKDGKGKGRREWMGDG